MNLPKFYIELLKPLYSICASGDYWGATFSRFIKDELRVISFRSDLALHISDNNSSTDKIFVEYVDETLFAVIPVFDAVVDQIRPKFNSKTLEWDNVDFLELRQEIMVRSDGSKYLEIHQLEYLSKL